MRILLVGDVMGKCGRQAVKRWLPELRTRRAIDFAVVNGENAAGGLGATPAVLEELLGYGADVITLGNHTWAKKELVKRLDAVPATVRPANYPPGAPGRGSLLAETASGCKVGVVNLVGRVFMAPADCPFRAGVAAVQALREAGAQAIVVDMHAEATSEKVALGWYLDGQCSAVLGTHTHVQTADARVLPQGTAYMTDVGMTGPRDSVIGVECAPIIERFLTGLPSEFKAGRGAPMLCGALVDVDEATGRARSIERVCETACE